MKDLVNKIKETASTIQKSTVDMVSNMSNIAKEQEKILHLKRELSATKESLLSLYSKMGKLHYNNVMCPNAQNSSEMAKLFTSIQEASETQKDLEEKIELAEENLKKIKLAYEKQKFQDEFDRNKEKLDKALEYNIVNQAEYDEKLAQYTKKLNSFDEIKRIEEQHSMGIIDSAEKDYKIIKILND